MTQVVTRGPSWAFDQDVSNWKTRLVLVELEMHTLLQIPATAERLLEKTGLSVRLLDRSLRELASRGLLRTEMEGDLPPHIRVPISPSLRLAIYTRDGHRCVICQSPWMLSLDHIIPLSRGGADTLDNLRTLCLPCNIDKGAAMPGEVAP